VDEKDVVILHLTEIAEDAVIELKAVEKDLDDLYYDRAFNRACFELEFMNPTIH